MNDVVAGRDARSCWLVERDHIVVAESNLAT